MRLASLLGALVLLCPLAARAGVRDGFTRADYDAHVAALRGRVPKDFSIVVEPPFVVVGNGGEKAVRRSAEHTVRWAVERLGRDFFGRAPKVLLTIWLLSDRASYEAWSKRLTGEEPETPYGFYSRRHRALVMNIATGGGTLVHEIVHPFVEANLPGCPAWLNEGLGSLFEQSSERDGHIVGLTNWRLEGLQDALRKQRVPALRALVATDDDTFYGKDSGRNYAQARYLLYWLQERGLLQKFWRGYLRTRGEDRSGWTALTHAVGTGALAALDRDYRAFVLGLVFE